LAARWRVTDEQFSRRFEELAEQADAIEKSKRERETAYGFLPDIDNAVLVNWTVKVRHLLASVSGTDSQHFKQFAENEGQTAYQTTYDIFCRLEAVFLAAKEDFDGGYMNSFKTLVQAEVFDDELEQADELLKAGFAAPTAVIAGVVLETTLRDMCTEKAIPTGKLDKMNADLAKAGAYNKLLQKRITALADIRNCAAHGQNHQFSAGDVSDMIRDVRKFLADRGQ